MLNQNTCLVQFWLNWVIGLIANVKSLKKKLYFSCKYIYGEWIVYYMTS